MSSEPVVAQGTTARPPRRILRVAVIYLGSRVFTTALMVTMFVLANTEGWKFGGELSHTNFFAFSSTWDASFYRRIAETGYPATLPHAADGSIRPNQWAFLPLFPYLARAVMDVTGGSFDVVGVILATVFGLGAAVVLHQLLVQRVGTTAALWATIFFCFGPVSFVLQVAYAESLFLLLIFSALWAMMRRWYILMIPLGVAAAFTRPGAIALALALAVHLVLRFVRDDRPTIRATVSACAAGLLTVIASAVWPAIAAAVTGVPNAYLATELSWWTGFVGHVGFIPFSPWFIMAGRYLGVAGIIAVVALAVGFVWLLRRRSVRALGEEPLLFAGSYGLYLFAVFLPQQSLFRLLLPMAPLLGAPTLSRTRAVRVSILVASLLLQPIAIVFLWFLGYP